MSNKIFNNLLSVLLLIGVMTLSNQAFAQDITVTGKVTDETGSGMPGVNVLVKGTPNGTATDGNGVYTLSVGSRDAVLVFSFVGYATAEEVVGSRNTIDKQLTPDVETLTELVVTGYTIEKKADIIGSVAVVNSKDLAATPVANLANQLQGRAAGVLVSGGGEPGSSAKVRIRGFTSFGKSDPLYVIDGVPTQDASRVNPNDIESVQVLKDATAASIYGSRAAAGVIIVTTKQGKPGKPSVTYDGYVGSSFIPKSTFPDLVKTPEYVEYLERKLPAGSSHVIFGKVNDGLSIPDYFVVSTLPGSGNSFKRPFMAGAPQVNPDLYSVPVDDYSAIYTISKVSRGTNWFKEVTRPGIIQNHQLGLSGGSESATYSIGLNYFNQEGAFKYSGYKRYSLRTNTSFKVNNFFRVGENLQVIHEEFMNAGTNGSSVRGEGSAWAQSFRMVPYIPVHDIGGGWGGNGIGDSGNGTNPVAQLYRDKDDVRRNVKILGNVYGELNPIKDLTVRTSFGLEYGNFYTKDIVKRTYERAENVTSTGLNVNNNFRWTWTWTNTIAYSKTFLDDHSIKLLAGTEAIKSGGDGLETQNVNGFDFEDPNFINLDTDQAAGFGVRASQPTISALASYFGRIDYAFRDKYLFNATVRRDGYSGFGPANRYGVFPAFGVGWRISAEPFMASQTIFSDLKLRAGWGQMGSQNNVLPQNSFSTFGYHPGLGNYDIGRTQNGTVVGYAPTFYGTNKTKWETSESTNIGFDASLLGGKLDVSFSYFNVETKDLLVERLRNGLETVGNGLPRVNIGEMRNRGIEFDVTNRGNITPDIGYTATVTFTHNRNEATRIDENPSSFISRNASRLTDVIRTTSGEPISSFWGFERNGFFEDQADLDALSQPDAVVGSWRYKDQNGDGVINNDDKVFIGNPQPDFVLGLNIGLTYKAFDLSAFFVWNYGNDLFNYTKYFTHMQGFVGGVHKDVLRKSWSPENTNGSMPILEPGANGYTPFIVSTASDFYIESGSYFRGKTLQIGYTLPVDIANKVKFNKARVYVQAQNFFTITDYTGADPDIGIQGGDINNANADLFMGVDESSTPNPRQFIVGLNLTF
jgi:TonB-dependent starch-binding outer membrane protein SusC